MVLDRMQNRLGESTCRTGKHQDWPADSRYAAYFSDDAADDRANLIYTDTHEATPLHRQLSLSEINDVLSSAICGGVEGRSWKRLTFREVKNHHYQAICTVV